MRVRLLRSALLDHYNAIDDDGEAVDRFALIYEIDADETRVLAVAHHSRRPGDWRDRE